LSDQPRGNAAVIDDFCVAWLNGPATVLAYVREDDSGQIDEEFDLNDCDWLDWCGRAQTWLQHPLFSGRYRPQILSWTAKSDEDGGTTV
jgi:hypothetical protein